MLRSSVMRALVLLGLAALFVAPTAHAQPRTALADTGRLIIFQGDAPVARESFWFTVMGDSLFVVAVNERQLQDDQGQRHPFKKTLTMVVDARDFGLLRYTSSQEFQGHVTTRGLVPGDTSITYYEEFDGAGNAMRLVQPPGRLFVMDGQLFSLFEVLCRSLADKTFTSRRVQLLTLADSMATPLATITQGKRDTLAFGNRRIPTRRYTFEDPTARFELWADARGRLLRLVHEPTGLHVVREPEAAPPPRRRTRTAR